MTSRHTAGLLAHYGIKKKLSSLHQHNEKSKSNLSKIKKLNISRSKACFRIRPQVRGGKRGFR